MTRNFPYNVSPQCSTRKRGYKKVYKFVLSPGQTIATCQRNMSQHCFARVWPPCCNMLGVVGSSLKLVKLEPTTPNLSQHIATRWPNARNMLRPTMLRHVVLACCHRLAKALIVMSGKHCVLFEKHSCILRLFIKLASYQ